MRNFSPRSQQQNERLITRVQGDIPGAPDFSGGMWNDGTSVPPNGVKYLENYRSHGKYLEARPGNKNHSDTVGPAIPGRTGYTMTSTVSGTTRTITKSVGASFSQTDEDNGRYFVFDNGDRELITNYVGTTSVETLCVSSATTHLASETACYVAGAIKGRYYHRTERKLVVMFDQYVYITDPITISYTRVFNISYVDPDGSVASAMDEFKTFVFIFNKNGIYKVDVTTPASTKAYLMYRVNSYNSIIRVTESNISTQGVVTAGYPYIRRYIYLPLRITGVTGLRDRTTTGAVIEQMGAPVLAQAASSYKDYGAICTARPPGSGETTYGVNTGGTLDAAYDTAAKWAALGSNCQFNIPINGTTKNCTANFAGCLSMDDVAARLQTAIRNAFNTSTYTCKTTVTFSTDHFIITSPDESGAVGYTTAGSGGTENIGTSAMACENAAGGGTITTPTYSAVRTVGTLTVPLETTNYVYEEKHWTHHGLYCTLDIGVNGINPADGLANNKELLIWHSDVHIARAFTAAEDGTSHVITLADSKKFTQGDVGATFAFQDGSTSVIQYLCDAAGTQVYTATSSYAKGNHADAVASQSACLGSGRVATAAQAVSGTETIGGATITSAEGSGHFIAADVGRTFTWADGTESHIVALLTTHTVEVAESTAVSSQAGTVGAVARLCCDYIPDETLRYRAASKELLLLNRLWEPLPSSNAGAVNMGFLICGLRDEQTGNYSQMPTNMEYMVGCHNPEYQTFTVKDVIRIIKSFPDRVIIWCANRTYEMVLNVVSYKTIEQIGEVIAIIDSLNELSDSVGAIAATPMENGLYGVITAEPAIRIFNGRSYGENLADGRIMNILREYNSSFELCYDSVNGLSFWALQV